MEPVTVITLYRLLLRAYKRFCSSTLTQNYGKESIVSPFILRPFIAASCSSARPFIAVSSSARVTQSTFKASRFLNVNWV